MEILKKYEEKFNIKKSNILVDKSWVQNFKNKDSDGNKRFKYNTSKLYGDVLDVGSADGYGIFIMKQLLKIKKIVGLEIQDAAIELSNINLKKCFTDLSNIKIVKGIGENIPFPDNTFDCVHCGQTLEHVYDDEKVVKEIERVVKDIAVFSVPIKGGINKEHVREYKNKEEILKLLSKYFFVDSYKIWEKKKIKGSRIERISIICRKINNKNDK
jgi:ubiquinone/menaquinone biosynthesis C-methylase UbiE